MLNKISAFFSNIANGRTFTAALLIYLVFGGYVMPHGAKKMAELSGKPVEILDLQFRYSPERTRSILADYSPEARGYAANFNLVDDSIYPLVYGFLFIIITAWVFKSLLRYRIAYYKHIHLLPLLIMLADYGENYGIITMHRSYPNFSDDLSRATFVLTSLKWGLVGVNTMVILGGLSVLLYCRFTKGKPQI